MLPHETSGLSGSQGNRTHPMREENWESTEKLKVVPWYVYSPLSEEPGLVVPVGQLRNTSCSWLERFFRPKVVVVWVLNKWGEHCHSAPVTKACFSRNAHSGWRAPLVSRYQGGDGRSVSKGPWGDFLVEIGTLIEDVFSLEKKAFNPSPLVPTGPQAVLG